jgi:hypothetical protein
MASITQRYNVGGVPPRLQPLRHARLLAGAWFPKDADLGDPRGYFMRYGTDHHAVVLSDTYVDQMFQGPLGGS